jgi:hypothetical protein
MNNPVTENDLNEVRAIRLGWQIDPIKVVLIAMPVILIVMGIVQVYQGRSLPVSVQGARAPYATYVLGLYILFFVWFIWSPWRRGKILIQKKNLSVPRFFRVQVFQRGKTSVVIDRLSAEFHVCKVSDEHQTAIFCANARSVNLLNVWATPRTNESAASEDDE